jgi:hypothetical protein
MVRFHCPEFVDLIETNEIFVARTRGVGRMSPELAIDMSLTGPPLRATGVDFDVRRDYPHSWYPNVEFNVVTDAAGEHCGARTDEADVPQLDAHTEPPYVRPDICFLPIRSTAYGKSPEARQKVVERFLDPCTLLGRMG